MIHTTGNSFAPLGLRYSPLVWILAFFLLHSGDTWTQQAPIGQGPAPRKALKIREAQFSVIDAKSIEHYQRIDHSQRFLLKSIDKETRYEWSVGDRRVPGEGPSEAPAELEGETSVQLLHHEGTVFAKIESIVPPSEEKRATEVRFTGTYEVIPIEGDWKSYEAGGNLKLRLASADHERFLTEVVKAFFGPEVLAPQAETFRTKLLHELEAKANTPGDLPEREVNAIKATVTVLKKHPEALSVTVTPNLKAKPITFSIEGDRMTATTIDQVLSFLYTAELHL